MIGQINLMKSVGNFDPPCHPPSWHSMFGLHVPFARSGAGEPPFLQLRIMDEYANLPHIPDDDGEAGGPAHGPFGHQPGHLPDFTDNMLAQMDPALATPANFALGCCAYSYMGTFIMRRTSIVPFRVWSHLGGDRADWIQQIVNVWADIIDVDIPKAFTLPTPMPYRGHADQFVALDVIVSQGLHHPRFSGLVFERALSG